MNGLPPTRPVKPGMGRKVSVRWLQSTCGETKSVSKRCMFPANIQEPDKEEESTLSRSTTEEDQTDQPILRAPEALQKK